MKTNDYSGVGCIPPVHADWSPLRSTVLKLTNLGAPVISGATLLIGSAASAGVLVTSAPALAVAAGAVRMRLDTNTGVEVVCVVEVGSMVTVSVLRVGSAVSSTEDSAMVEEVVSSTEVSVVDSVMVEEVVSSKRVSAEVVVVELATEGEVPSTTEVEAEDSTMVEEVVSSTRVSIAADLVVVEGVVSNTRVSAEGMAVDSTMVEGVVSDIVSTEAMIEVGKAEVATSVKVPTNIIVEVSTDMASGLVAAVSEALGAVSDIETAISLKVLTGIARTGVGAMALTHPVLVLVMRVDTDDAGGSVGGLLAAP